MRLIDVDALPKLLDAEYKQTMKLIREGEKRLNTLAEGFTEAIHIAKYIAPTVDAVPVVRCKDCERWQRHTQGKRDYGECRRFSVTTKNDAFCSRGERRG